MVARLGKKRVKLKDLGSSNIKKSAGDGIFASNGKMNNLLISSI